MSHDKIYLTIILFINIAKVVDCKFKYFFPFDEYVASIEGGIGANDIVINVCKMNFL